MPAEVLERIDAHCEATGQTRTEFLTRSAEAAMALTRQPVVSWVNSSGEAVPGPYCSHPVNRRIGKGCGACGDAQAHGR